MKAAVDVDDLTGDKAGKRRAQEQDHVGDFFGLAKAADRNAAQKVLPLLLGELLGDHVGFDVRGRDSVGSDAVSGKLARKIVLKVKASKGARAMIEAAGGKVELTEKPEPEKKDRSAKKEKKKAAAEKAANAAGNAEESPKA